ncbi:NADH-cytochrome b5 reductase-like isoform X2 [Rana temporaria]|uniref:NADH-cytochrome b5 reductase-like isoform X2 n=1 Tax=Rana temporaria TaxID=8407 RepID=UPI001AAD79D1|nr:NADH-cytochrome b5 reductase-like isoform X2 [Rana temporaria]
MGDPDGTDWQELRPVEPTPAQCCGSGCSPCVYDIYQADLELWEKARDRGDPQILRRTKDKENPSVLLSSEAFRDFKILSVEEETEDTNRYRFQLPPGASLGLNLGQHLVLRGRVNGLDIQRAYTPISSIDAKDYFDVLIKFGELLMLCSGTGLAPMIPILTSVTDNEQDETFVTLVVCFRTFKNIYMKNFLQEQARFWNVRLFYVFSQEQSLENLPMSYKKNSKIGRINSTFLEMVLGTCRRKPYTLICGSVSFTEDMIHMVNELGHNKDSVFSF